MVKSPAEYQWSGYRVNALGEQQGNYLLSFNAAIDPADEKLIRQAATCSMPTGNSRFMAQIEAAIKRKIGYEI
jgi:uncharacterized protein (DUF1684 family)